MLFVQNLKNCENETYDIMVKEIIEITKVYLETDDVKLSSLNENDTLNVKIGELQECGLLDWNLENPKTHKNIASDSYVAVAKGIDSVITYEYHQK